MTLFNESDELKKGIEYHQRNNLELAEKSYKLILEKNPHHPLALSLLGTIFIQKEKIKEAVYFFSKSISFDSKQAFSFCNLGIAQYLLKRYKSSLENLNTAIALKFDYAEAFNARGNTLSKLGFIYEALQSYNHALKIDPLFTDAYINRGDLFHNLKDFDNALNNYLKAKEISPNDERILKKCGEFFKENNFFDKAIIEYKELVKISPQNKYALLNLALCYQKIKDFAQAIIHYDLAIKQDGNFIEALNNKALIYQELANYSAALELYKKVLELNNSFVETKLNIGIIKLIFREYYEGWRLYEYRWPDRAKIFPNKPELTNFSLSQKIIYIWAEQGLGDQIIFSSLFFDALKTKNQFFISLDPRLIPIYKRSFSHLGHVKFISANQKFFESKYDFHLPLASLGKFFRNSIQDFNLQPVAYLKANKVQVKSLKMKLKKEGYKICGISWKSKNVDIGKEKSLSLLQLLPILSIPNITFVDLQYGDTNKEKRYILNTYGIEIKSIDEIDNFNDLDGLASLVEACDFIVTTSNITAHLAGALNKKTYLLLPFSLGKIWYWSESLSYSLWYPSIDIYRQTDFAQWDKIINQLSDKLEGLYA